MKRVISRCALWAGLSLVLIAAAISVGQSAGTMLGEAEAQALIQKDYLRPAGEKIGLQGVGGHSFRHSFRHTYRTLIDDIGTPLGVQQRLMRHADIKTTMNTYGSAFEKTKRRANSRVSRQRRDIQRCR
jgi:site-specific recombinase XerD